MRKIHSSTHAHCTRWPALADEDLPLSLLASNIFVHFKQAFRPENVSAATSNHNERFWRVCVVLRGATVVQTRRILPAAVPENLTPEFAVIHIFPWIMTRS